MGSETKHSGSRSCGRGPPHQQAARTCGIRGVKGQDLVEEEGMCNTDRWGTREAGLGKLFKLASSPVLYS